MRTLLLVAAAASPAVPAQITGREVLIPRTNAFPPDPAVGADGIVWYPALSDRRIRASRLRRLASALGDGTVRVVAQACPRA